MKRWFTIYKELLSTSFKEYIRDPIATIFTTLMPLSFLMIFGLTSSIVGENNNFVLSISVGQSTSKIVKEPSTVTSKVIDILSQKSIFMVTQSSEAEIRTALSKGKLHAGVLVDENGSITVLSMLSTETINDLIQELLSKGLVNDTTLKIEENLASKNSNVKQETLAAEPFSYINFLLPAILALSLVQLCLYGTATPLVGAKERGIFRYYAVVPMPKSALLAAQISVRFCLAVIQITMLLLLSHYTLDMEIKGSILALIGFLSLSAVMLITGGYALGGLFKTLTTATAVIMILNFYLMAFGQIFIDLESVPVAKYAILTTPVGFVSDATRQIILDSTGMFPMYINVMGVLFWFVLLAFIAIKYFKFLPKSD